MGVFHVFKIIKMVPNRGTHHIYRTDTRKSLKKFNLIFLELLKKSSLKQKKKCFLKMRTNNQQYVEHKYSMSLCFRNFQLWAKSLAIMVSYWMNFMAHKFKWLQGASAPNILHMYILCMYLRFKSMSTIYFTILVVRFVVIKTGVQQFKHYWFHCKTITWELLYNTIGCTNSNKNGELNQLNI